jgi:hypothetical protein
LAAEFLAAEFLAADFLAVWGYRSFGFERAIAEPCKIKVQCAVVGPFKGHF